jgi:hypothetical protein
MLIELHIVKVISLESAKHEVGFELIDLPPWGIALLLTQRPVRDKLVLLIKHAIRGEYLYI